MARPSGRYDCYRRLYRFAESGTGTLRPAPSESQSLAEGC